MSDRTTSNPGEIQVDTEGSPPGFARYCGPAPFDELPIPETPNAADYEWAFNDQQLHRQYQGLVVAVRDRKVWGAGKDAASAWEEARKKPGCPDEDDLAFVQIWGMPGKREGTAGSEGA